MCKIYGYCRISRKSQDINRQVRNISKAYPESIIFQEAFTGTKIQGRKELDKVLSVVKSGDTIVFDSVSRMSRNAKEGITLYFDLYEKGVNLVFLKERHIDTESYKQALNESGYTVKTDGTAEGELVADIMKALNKFMIAKVRSDIEKAFEQAEKEVTDLQERTSEGLLTAKLNGKQVGQKKGSKLTTKKSIEAKQKIRKFSSDFEGNMNDTEMIEYLKINRNTFYKYKRELKQEIAF